ncbi:MAG: hypothetical protein M1827_001204 [Pycnora praestabilis]|nr:MAG: hypothetical protein M1827_001204 [Pycnora praestabilis]
MVLGLLAIAGIPTTIGVWQGIDEGKKKQKEDNDEKWLVKFNLEVYCEAKTHHRKEVHGQRVVLRDDKMYIHSPSYPRAHPFTGFYINYPFPPPDPELPTPPQDPVRGLVSTISTDPPMLNWLYVDKDTCEVRYGNRTKSMDHIVGPWSWTKEDEVGLVLEGEEGFVAVLEEEEEGDEEKEGKAVWAIYYDREGDGLKSLRSIKGKKVLEVSLERKIIPEEKKPEEKKEEEKR